MSAPLGRPIRTFLALSVTVASLTAVSLPAHAGDGGAIAAGVIGGTALGVLAGAAIAGAPPPPVYYAVATVVKGEVSIKGVCEVLALVIIEQILPEWNRAATNNWLNLRANTKLDWEYPSADMGL